MLCRCWAELLSPWTRWWRSRKGCWDSASWRSTGELWSALCSRTTLTETSEKKENRTERGNWSACPTEPGRGRECRCCESIWRADVPANFTLHSNPVPSARDPVQRIGPSGSYPECERRCGVVKNVHSWLQPDLQLAFTHTHACVTILVRTFHWQTFSHGNQFYLVFTKMYIVGLTHKPQTHTHVCFAISVRTFSWNHGYCS